MHKFGDEAMLLTCSVMQHHEIDRFPITPYHFSCVNTFCPTQSSKKCSSTRPNDCGRHLGKLIGHNSTYVLSGQCTFRQFVHLILDGFSISNCKRNLLNLVSIFIKNKCCTIAYSLIPRRLRRKNRSTFHQFCHQLNTYVAL